MGVEIRDPNRNNKHVGPTHSVIGDTDEDEPEDTELHRLEPGEQFLKQYTFTTERKANGVLPNDF